MSDGIFNDESVIEDLAARISGMLRGEEGHQWRWADIAAAAPSEDVLRTAAERAGFFETHSWATMKHWRFVGLAWPAEKREAETSFTAHAELASVQPDERRWALMRAGLSKREARRLSGRKAMKDDVDAGLERMLDDQANEDVILEKALEIESRRNARTAERQHPDDEYTPYLRATGYLATSLSALTKALEIAKDLSGYELELVLEQTQEIEAKAAHASAELGDTPDTVPPEFLSYPNKNKEN